MQMATQLWNSMTGNAPDEAARGLIVRFSLEMEEDEKATHEAGRPMYAEHEYIEIRSPNDPLSIIHRRVEDKDKRAFSQLYKRFKEGLQDVLHGSALKEWAPIARSQVEKLAFAGVRTVEELAEVDDTGCSALGHGYLTLRDKARAWLAQAKDASAVTKLTAESAEKDRRIQMLERQMSELHELVKQDKEAREAAQDEPRSKKGKS